MVDESRQNQRGRQGGAGFPRWIARAWALPRKASTGTRGQVQKGYVRLKCRYGLRYNKAMLLAAFVALFSPVPGSALVAVLLVVVIAEAHRRISSRRGWAVTTL